jgi:hypothetical protein
MAITYTFERLLTIAADAVGLARENLTAAETARLGEIVNEVGTALALKRHWLHLVADATLPVVSTDTYVLLPANFLRFNVDSEITYAPGQAFGVLRKVGMEQIRAMRMPGAVSGNPRVCALGSSVDSGDNRGRRRLELWPDSDGTYSLRTSYYRLPATMSVSTDTPDFPVALMPAYRTLVQIGAKEEFDQAVPDDWAARAERQIFDAAAALGAEARFDTTGLCDVVSGEDDLAPGLVRELDVSGLELL